MAWETFSTWILTIKNSFKPSQQLWRNKTGIIIEDYPKDTKIQAKWDSPGCKLILNSPIEDSTNPTERERLLALSQEPASDWLEALPSPALGLKLENQPS